MLKRDKTKEKQIEEILKSHFGELISFKYERPKTNKERTIERIEVTGIITKFEEDLRGSNYGHSVYVNCDGEERRYLTRRISNL